VWLVVCPAILLVPSKGPEIYSKHKAYKTAIEAAGDDISKLVVITVT
jgi:hypothetical protein